MKKRSRNARLPVLGKTPTGIEGLDVILEGGLPAGRPTLVCGGPGCGKTLLALEFLVRGATRFGEPGAFICFEETPDELARNAASLGFDLAGLEKSGLLAVDYVFLDRHEIAETGEYDLEGLFIRIGAAIDAVGAKRVAIDTLEALFAALPNEFIVRAELRRLFRYLKERNVTAVITGERGERTLTRHGLEEYVSDCVIVLDHRIVEHVATRHLRAVKYRGSRHQTNEFPFLIDDGGISVLPITSAGLQHEATRHRISTGVAGLDEMLGGSGIYRGSTLLLSGTGGTGKTSVAAHFAAAACARKERALYCSFEESSSQIIRNMRSIGLDLARWQSSGLLSFHCARPTSGGLEYHLAVLLRRIAERKPSVVVIDPATSLEAVGGGVETKAMLVRLIDFLKNSGITSVLTSLIAGGHPLETSDVGISSIVDVWVVLRDIELNGERNRLVHVLKARGMNHSNQVREFIISSQGIRLVDAWLGPEGVLTGSARVAQERTAHLDAKRREMAIAARKRELARRKAALDAQIAALTAAFEAEAEQIRSEISNEGTVEKELEAARRAMAVSRGVSSAPEGNGHDAGKGQGRK
ncbi:MAG TPA: circadian clock protein KaiC [Thermoanaerobaculia bacterium]|nr:circadian clock protein KaiC [Thermoanaerobaculia bacterium]